MRFRLKGMLFFASPVVMETSTVIADTIIGRMHTRCADRRNNATRTTRHHGICLIRRQIGWIQMWMMLMVCVLECVGFFIHHMI